MRIGQRETGRRVVERRVEPRHGIMTIRASSDRKYAGCGRMLRIVGLLPGGKVAARMPAVGRRNLQIVVSTDVATLAGNIRVPVRPRAIDRRGCVVYRCSQPPTVRAALLACLRVP